MCNLVVHLGSNNCHQAAGWWEFRISSRVVLERWPDTLLFCFDVLSLGKQDVLTQSSLAVLRLLDPGIRQIKLKILTVSSSLWWDCTWVTECHAWWKHDPVPNPLTDKRHSWNHSRPSSMRKVFIVKSNKVVLNFSGSSSYKKNIRFMTLQVLLGHINCKSSVTHTYNISYNSTKIQFK